MGDWQPIETAPKDCDILVWYDHDADPYLDPHDQSILTAYAACAEVGDHMNGKGLCIAKWFGSTWEHADEFGGGYVIPACWFALHNGDYELAVNPTHWTPMPEPPK